MPRQVRESSGTGIYHVMMRGINRQNIFEEQEDYYQFLNTLDMMAQAYEPDGTPFGRNYILYAYCLMSNHIHLLIREREDKIGMVWSIQKRILQNQEELLLAWNLIGKQKILK